MKRLILEMGTGTDLYGGDYTKAACRAVRIASKLPSAEDSCCAIASPVADTQREVTALVRYGAVVSAWS